MEANNALATGIYICKYLNSVSTQILFFTVATVFAGNLAWSTTTEMLHDFVTAENVPDFVKCEVKRHEDTRRSKGWG